MSQCDAIVVEASEREVLVEVPSRAPACGSCQSADACQDSLLGQGAAPRRYRLENRIGARVGDSVRLTVAEGALWRASLASYVLPVLLALAGAMIGQSMAGDAAAVAGTLAGLGCGLALLRWRELRARRQGQLFSLHVKSMEVRFKESS